MSAQGALKFKRESGHLSTLAMRLFWSPRSPFSRKVMIAAHERGISSLIELVPTLTGSTLLNSELMAYNPLNRIPALVLEDGRCLWESRVICEYLDALEGHRRLLPADHDARLDCLRWQALGDSIMELNVARLVEASREPAMQSTRHTEAYRAKTLAVVDLIEAQGQTMLTEPVHLGHVSIACALSHVDFRFESDRWRSRAPILATWYESFSQRPSMRDTAFREDRAEVQAKDDS